MGFLVYLTVMVLVQDVYSACEVSQIFRELEDSGGPSIISRDSLLQLRLLQQRKKHASAFGIVVPPAGSLPTWTQPNHIALLTRLLRHDAHREGDSPFWRRGWWLPRTLPTPGLQVTPCLLSSPTDGAQGSPPRTLGSGATGGNSTVNPEDCFLGQQEWSQLRPRHACVTPLLLHLLHPWHKEPRTPY